MFLDLIKVEDALGSIETPGLSGTFQAIMEITIPFIMLIVMLTTAKKLAVSYSGKIGEGLIKMAKVAGGVALGAAGGMALGATGMLARQTIGRAGSAMARGSNLQ